jgi:hypothetical protein
MLKTKQFVIGDFGLGSAMVILFTVPLLGHAKSMSNVGFGHDVSKDLVKIIKSNFIYSSLIITSGVISLAVYSSFFLIYKTEKVFHAFADITPNSDLLFVIILVHLMDTHWMPDSWRARLFHPNKVEDVSNGATGLRQSKSVEQSASSASFNFFGFFKRYSTMRNRKAVGDEHAYSHPKSALAVSPASTAGAGGGGDASNNEEPKTMESGT